MFGAHVARPQQVGDLRHKLAGLDAADPKVEAVGLQAVFLALGVPDLLAIGLGERAKDPFRCG